MKVLVDKKTLYIINDTPDNYINEIANDDRYEVLNTLSEAEDYIFKNKTCLSYNDVIEICNMCAANNFDPLAIGYIGNLTNFIKSKI